MPTLTAAGSSPPSPTRAQREGIPVEMRLAAPKAARHPLLTLLICVGGIYGAYIMYGLLQEEVYSYVSPSGEKFTSTQTLLLVQFVVSAIAAYIISTLSGDKPVPVREFALAGFSYTGGMLGSNEALRFVSYPTQVLAKSCKLVPVLLVNVLWYHRKQTVWQYINVVFVTLGLIVFRYDVSRTEGEGSSHYGLFLLVVSLAMDGITGPSQEDLRNRYRPSSQQFILYCNLWGCIFLSLTLMATGEGLSGVHFILAKENRSLAWSIVTFCVCSTVGQNFIFLTLRNFGYVVQTRALRQ